MRIRTPSAATVRSGLVTTLVAGAAALVAIGIAPAVEGDVGPGTVEIEGSLASPGVTRLDVPPLGRVSARTHDAPLGVTLSVRQIDIDAVQRIVRDEPSTDELSRAATTDLEVLARRFTLVVMLAGTGAGALAGLVVSRHRWRHVVLGAAVGLGSVALLMLAAWRGYDVEAFEHARFTRPIERAPSVLEAAERHVGGLEDVRARVETLSRQITDLYTLAATGTGLESPREETRILHVSDLHSNPLGAALVADLASDFDVHAVLDTGDLTSFGLPVESRIGDVIESADVPYLFVPGNHDSDENRAALRGVPNVFLVDGRVLRVRDVRILGVADPTFTAGTDVGTGEAIDAKVAAAPGVARLVRAHRPDVLAVHDARLAQRSLGDVPLVVAGHLHKRRLETRQGTRVLHVGSVGSTGLGSFTVDSARSYEAEVLHFRDGCLVAVDYLVLNGVQGDFTLDREVFDAGTCPPVRSR